MLIKWLKEKLKTKRTPLPNIKETPPLNIFVEEKKLITLRSKVELPLEVPQERIISITQKELFEAIRPYIKINIRREGNKVIGEGEIICENKGEN